MPETRRLTHSTCWLGSSREVVAVQRAVLGVEPVRDRREHVLVDGALRHRDPDLEGLAEVAQVGGAHELVVGVREALAGQRRRAPGR